MIQKHIRRFLAQRFLQARLKEKRKQKKRANSQISIENNDLKKYLESNKKYKAFISRSFSSARTNPRTHIIKNIPLTKPTNNTNNTSKRLWYTQRVSDNSNTEKCTNSKEKLSSTLNQQRNPALFHINSSKSFHHTTNPEINKSLQITQSQKTLKSMKAMKSLKSMKSARSTQQNEQNGVKSNIIKRVKIIRNASFNNLKAATMRHESYEMKMMKEELIHTQKLLLKNLRLNHQHESQHLIEGLEVNQVNCFDEEHNSPVYYAAQNGNIHLLQLLLTKNASVNTCNHFQDTPLHVAFKNKHNQVDEFYFFLIFLGCKNANCLWS